MTIRNICVFCGASPGARTDYMETAAELGRLLAAQGVTLVYGGGNIGLMGEIADTVMKNGGKVIGVIPKALADKEVAKHDITELHIVRDMHERKGMMASLADAFIALPGGIGTFEEFAEIVTWAQLGFHGKPCGLLNTANYYGHFITFLDHAVAERFFRAEHRELILVDQEPGSLIERLREYRPPEDIGKWIGRRVD